MKKNGFVQRLQIQQEIRDQEVRHHTRVFQMDLVTIALGRMGFREKRFRQFDQMMTVVCNEYSDLILKDAKDDKEIVYAKACLDRELQQYTGKMFVPYDERYK